MQVFLSSESPERVAADVLIIGLYERGLVPQEIAEPMGTVVQSAVAAGDFTGEFGQSALFYTGGAMAARKLLLYGLGEEGKITPLRFRRAAGMAARAARNTGASSVAMLLPALPGHEPGRAAQVLAEGAVHGLYRFDTLKTHDKSKQNVGHFIVVGPAGVASAVERGAILGEAVNRARALNWLPGNHLTASGLADRALQLGREAGLEVEVYDRQGCASLGLGLLLAVNQGSVEEPRFIVMRYRGNGGRGPWLGLVGKGITFDTGGISIKPSDPMWDMKYDMSGAGAVFGAMQAIAQLRPACDILAVIAATDNMPDGGAYKPGDVISGLSGKTVEVRSTDAEGRLVLADGLAYAVQQGCTRLVTASTLTGAARVALGPMRFAIVANDDDWEETVFDAAETAGERGWRMPHDEEYYDLFKSQIADMANSGTARSAGTIVGGLFLMKHVGKVPCVHMDIAAQAWIDKKDDYEDPGATGVGVRTFVQVAQRFAEENG